MRRIHLCIAHILLASSPLSSHYLEGMIWFTIVNQAFSVSSERGGHLKGVNHLIVRQVFDFTRAHFFFSFPQKVMALQHIYQVDWVRRNPISKHRRLRGDHGPQFSAILNQHLPLEWSRWTTGNENRFLSRFHCDRTEIQASLGMVSFQQTDKIWKKLFHQHFFNMQL